MGCPALDRAWNCWCVKSVQIWLWWLVAVALGAEDPAASGSYTPNNEDWHSLVARGILDEGYLARINCEGTEWDKFRNLYQEHVESGRWNYADAALWVQEPGVWEMVREAEELLETWRRKDFEINSIAEGDTKERMMHYRRNPSKQPLVILDQFALGDLSAFHLAHVAGGAKATAGSTFASKCFLGLITALVVFGRALAILGVGVPVPEGSEDGFLLWRVEMGYILAVLMWGEGALVPDLTTAPGWPLVSSRFVEQVLSRPLNADSRTAASLGNDTIALGFPRRVREVRPTRIPSFERRHRATDPMGVTSWGSGVGRWMAERTEMLSKTWGLGRDIPWKRIGPAWVVGPSFDMRQRALPRSRLRLLGLVSWHGALDLEVPELLKALFPGRVELKYVLYGENVGVICNKTEGSLDLDALCKEWNGGKGAGGKLNMRLSHWEPLSGEWLLDPQDPRLYFHHQPPELITTTSFKEAIWASRRFPDIPMILFFGPTLLMQSATDIQAGRQAAVNNFWVGFWELCTRCVSGKALLAAESLFRSEQFYYQTGIEVPFLRPMSVWVNASYRFASHSPRPATPGEPRGDVLVHSRGRLKHEVSFVGVLRNMAGRAFPFRIVTQGGRIVPFKELAGMHAVAILPWSPEICMLRHLFKMRVPLFVPDRNLLVNMVHISNQRLLPFPYYHHIPHHDKEAMSAVHPYDPFLDTALPPADVRGMAARAYWAEYSEYLLLPCLQHFRSAAELLAKLHAMEPTRISAQMAAAHAQDMEEMASFWTETLTTMLAKP